MIDLSEYVVSDQEIHGGHPIFRGTRVPIEILFENLEDGLSLDEILDSYPTIPRPAAIAVLEASKSKIL